MDNAFIIFLLEIFHECIYTIMKENELKIQVFQMIIVSKIYRKLCVEANRKEEDFVRK